MRPQVPSPMELTRATRRTAASLAASRKDERAVHPLPVSETMDHPDLKRRVLSQDHDTLPPHRKARKVSPRAGTGSPHSASASSSAEEDNDVAVDADDEDAFIAARNNTARKAQLPAAHEVKYLRHEAAALDRRLQQLCEKWRRYLPDPKVLLRACEAAKAKTITMQVERINAELKQQLLQQQLFFSSLQSSLSESPFWRSNKTCQDLFYDIHSNLKLSDTSDDQRREALLSRFESTRRHAEAVVDRYTREHVHKTSPAIPYSHTATSGTEEFTYLSNMFICKIPNATLGAVFQAAVEHYTHLPEQVERHLGQRMTSKPICSVGDQRHYSQLECCSGDFAGVLSNVTFQAEMVDDDLAFIAIDFVDEDDLYPSTQLRKDGNSLLVLTRVMDAFTGRPCILLRRLLAHRYNLLPNSSRLHKEVNSLVSYVNGDLTMAMLCQSLQANALQTASR